MSKVFIVSSRWPVNPDDVRVFSTIAGAKKFIHAVSKTHRGSTYLGRDVITEVICPYCGTTHDCREVT